MKKPQLFLLHFAGGNCYSFQFLIPLLEYFDIETLELPGRGKRMDENLLKDFDLAAEDIYKQIREKLTAPDFVIYGHSMGAYIGLRVSNMLEKIGRVPSYLIVSGNAGPGIKRERTRYLLETNDFIEELKKIGGAPKEFFESPELFEFFEPILRADFEVVEKNELNIEASVNCPIYAIMGNQEEKVEKIENWGKFTQSRFNSEVLEGGHFFIHEHPRRIAQIIMTCYDNAALT